MLQPVKLRNRAARCNGISRARKERRELAAATAKATEFLAGTYFAIARDWRRAAAGVVKGGSCPYDFEIVDSASVYGLRLLTSSKNNRALDEELLPPPT